MKNQISLASPKIFSDTKKHVLKSIKNNWISSYGKFIWKFENEIKKYTNSKNAVVCSSGTAALHISLVLSNVKKGDEVIVPTLTFIATINVVKYLDASPIFMDCDNFFNIDVKKTIEFLNQETVFKNNFTFNKKTGKKISAIIPVHVWGNAVKLKELIKICKKKNIKVIEDATESLGTFYTHKELNGKHTGTVGDFGCLSFNGNKIITAGAGGAILTKSNLLAKKAKYLISQSKDDKFKFIHNSLGYNYSLSNLNAAVGYSQMKKIKHITKLKLKISRNYKKILNKIQGLNLNLSPTYANNNRWLNILIIDKNKFKKKPSQLLKIFSKKNIETRHVWRLNHLQKNYKKCQKYKITNAHKLVESSLCLPSSSDITFAQIKKICRILINNK